MSDYSSPAVADTVRGMERLFKRQAFAHGLVRAVHEGVEAEVELHFSYRGITSASVQDTIDSLRSEYREVFGGEADTAKLPFVAADAGNAYGEALVVTILRDNVHRLGTPSLSRQNPAEVLKTRIDYVNTVLENVEKNVVDSADKKAPSSAAAAWRHGVAEGARRSVETHGSDVRKILDLFATVSKMKPRQAKREFPEVQRNTAIIEFEQRTATVSNPDELHVVRKMQFLDHTARQEEMLDETKRYENTKTRIWEEKLRRLPQEFDELFPEYESRDVHGDRAFFEAIANRSEIRQLQEARDALEADSAVQSIQIFSSLTD